MGVVHKLKPQIIEYIQSTKRDNPSLSCRKLVPLIKKKFRINVSKSSINSIFKSSGSSLSAGRQLEVFVDFAGAFFLQGANVKIGISNEFTESIKNDFKDMPEHTVRAYAEALIFSPLFGIKHIADLNKYQGSGLWVLAGLKYDRFLPSKINKFYNALLDNRLYYKIALRSVSLYSHLTDYKVIFPSEETIDSELKAMLFNLHKYAQKEFFPPIYSDFDIYRMREEVYSLGGFIRHSKTALFIRFSEYKNLDVQLDIAHACRKFNAAELTVLSGQKLYIQPLI